MGSISLDSTPENRERQPHSSSPSISDFPQKQTLICCLLLVAATLALYNPVTHAPFLNFDDDVYVTENLHVRSGISWSTVAWAMRSTEDNNWHPLTWISHAVDCQLFGLNPAGPHIVNVLFQAANAVLLFLLLLGATGRGWRSWMVAALFAIHPINVESVAWIAERKNVLSMFLFLLALAAYGWYARRPALGRYLAVSGAYALALMAKPQVITFPFALLLLDYWPLRRIKIDDPEIDGFTRRRFSVLIWEKLPWLGLSAASALITMHVQATAKWERLPLWIRLGNAAIAYVKYVGKTIWPVNLAPLYPHPNDSLSAISAALAALAVIAVTTVAVIYRKQRPYFVGWFWFVGTLVPMLGLVQVGVQSMADRYAYIPTIGILVIICWGAAEVIRRWRVSVAVTVAAVAVIFLALGFALHRQVGYWSDNLVLWSHTIAVTERNYTAEDNLATALIMQGKVEEALPHLRQALLWRPDDAVATLDVANYQRLRGNYREAIQGFAKVPQITREPLLVARAYLDSGYAHYSLKDYDSAKRDFDAALNVDPGVSAAYRALGLIAQKSGDLAQAAQNYRQSADLEPTSVGYLLLAQALELRGDASEARVARAHAAQLSGDLDADAAIVTQLLTD